MTKRKANPTPKGRARWPLEKCMAQVYVLAVLDKTRRSPGEIAAMVGCTYLSARAALHRLKARKLARNRGRKWYRV